MHKYIITFLICSMQSAFADVTAEKLIEECNDKTIVMESVEEKIQTVGEKLSGFCVGYFNGYIAASRDIICPKSDDPNFLLSVVNTYIEFSDVNMQNPAGEILSAALNRIYKCK
jgi:hypothetical protein